MTQVMSDRPTNRFPGLADGWARFDAPAGTLMVDSAIDAMTAFASDGRNANSGGAFAAAEATSAQLEAARSAVARLFGADPTGVVFGQSMTALTFAFSRAVGRLLRPGDRVLGTRLDHDANVTPWRLAAGEADADHELVPFDVDSGRLPADAVIDRLDDRVRWLTVTGASNLLGSQPDLPPLIEAAHTVGAKVFVDAVHLAPHAAIDVAALGCDALVTSPYKWYGPHSGVLCATPALLDELAHYRVRPSPPSGPGAWETGTPAFEALAAVEAAAEFLAEDEGAHRRADHDVFAHLLDGLTATEGVTIHGPADLIERTPTVAFTVEGSHPDEVAAALAADRIAVWSGHSYAVEVVDALGLTDRGGVVRAGVVRYVTRDDVDRLLHCLAHHCSARR